LARLCFAPDAWTFAHLSFLMTKANAVVEPIHPKAMPAILTTDEERDAHSIIQ
jgi:putative SOS response-associated peptidase YedK